MKILLLTPRVPYPPYRGDKLKIFNLLKRLSKKNTIHLISFVETRKELEYVEHLRPYCEVVDFVPLPRWRSFLQCLFGLFSNVPLQVHYFKSSRMQSLVCRVIKNAQFDIIHTHLIRMAQYTAEIKHPRKVLDLTDASSLYLKRFLSLEKNPLKKVILKVEVNRIVSYESILERFDTCLVCSKPDQSALKNTAPAADIRIIPNGVDLEYFSSNGSIAYDPSRIIFTGNLTYFPNIDAIFFFLKEIFPLIKKEIPSATFYIVGQSPPSKVRALASQDIVVTGFVEDIKAQYVQSAVAVSPVRFGAGTLNKILEPLALGIPVVATPIGVEGLNLTIGKNILVADNPRAFAMAVVRVMQEPELRGQLSREAMALVRRLYNWDTIVDSLEKVYQEILGARSAVKHPV